MQSRAVRPTKQPGPASQRSALNQGPASSNITTFVRCLRLLDLDQLADWPAITDTVFTTNAVQQNLQARIKAVEWSLYRLFEIYDPKETQTKLRPFFPSPAPLQSLNLRAALFRALTELKKNGVLGRDAALRKTMLDECKGDKFEEVISTFAFVVLRKACRSRHPELRLDKTDCIPQEQLVPLILAHRYSLQQSLQQRQSISQHISELSNRLESEQTNLQKRLEETQQGFQAVDEDDLAYLSKVVKHAWIGDDRWSTVLLEGRPCLASPVHQIAFNSNWTKPADDDQTNGDKSNDLAAELDERIEEQEKRLNKWKTFYASMANAQAKKAPKSKPATTLNKPPCLRFDQHDQLRPIFSRLQYPVEERLEHYHASVLKNMRDELAAMNSSIPIVSTSASERENDPKPSSQAMVSAITPEIIKQQSAQAVLDDSSPAASTQKDSATGVDAEHQRSSEAGHEIDTGPEVEEEENDATAHFDLSSIDMPPSTEYALKSEHSMNVPSSPPAGPRSGKDTPQALDVNEEYKNETTDVLKPNIKSAATLHERTRASLLPLVDRPRSPDSQPGTIADDEDDSQVLPLLPEMNTRRGTLLERTRQSMSLLPNLPPKSKSSRLSSVKQPRLSEAFPVNQFETPGKWQAQQSGAWSPRSGSSTARDKLFSEEADYASVFKSRPRIANSPLLSPQRSNLGPGSMLAEDVDDYDLEDTDDTPSRGLRRNA